MLKKILGAIAVFAVLTLVWFFTQDNGAQLLQDKLRVVSGDASAPAVAVNPPGFHPVADTLQSMKTNGVVRISNENPSEPFYGITGNVPHGFNVEFAQLLFSDPSFKSPEHNSVVADFNHSVDTYSKVPEQLLAKDNNGNPTVDIAMDGLTFADNTPPGVVYSIPYIDDFGYALIVTHGSNIRAVGDLAGKRIGILKGDPDVKVFVTKTYPNSTFVEVDDSDPAFISKSLASGSVDAFIYDYPFAVDAIKGTNLEFAITKLDGSNLVYKIGVRSQDQSLLIYLNAAIAKVKQSPEYMALLRKYFISAQTATSAATTGEHRYTVVDGDTLNEIASKMLGNGRRYREIQTRNNLANPNLVFVGQHLIIPVR